MYENVIPGDKTGAKPGEVSGGILADVIGLEKSLQILSNF